MSANSKIPQAQHRLSIHVSMNGLSFVVQDKTTKECIVWEYFPYTIPGNDYNDWAREIDGIFRRTDLLQKQFAHCEVCLDTCKHTLIPSPLFRPEQAVQVLKQLFSIADLDEINHMDIPSAGATCIYALPGPVSTTIVKRQRNARFYASILPLYEFLRTQKDYSRALLCYGETQIHLILMQGDKLLLCNSYAVDRFSTSLYFLFFALKQWQLNPHSLSLYITGPFKPTHLRQLCSFFSSVTVAANNEFLFPTESVNLQFAPHLFPVCASSADL